MSGERLVPNDRALPQLAQLFDTYAMARVLQPLAGMHSLSACTIERVKYRPGRACVVGYRLEGADRKVARIAVCMYEAQDTLERYRKASANAQPGQIAYLAQHNALAWVFPHDRKLPALALLADRKRLSAVALPALVQAHWGDAWQVRDVEHTVVSYFPEHTCTIALKVNLQEVYRPIEQTWTLYGKTRYDDAGAATYTHMQALWESPARREGLIGYARPLGYDAANRLLWQEGVSAPTLDSVLAAGADSDAALWARVGAGIAQLHATPIACTRTMNASAMLEEAQRAQQVLESALSDGAPLAGLPPASELVAAAARALGALSRAWWSIDFSAEATLHGDLHSNNILVGAERIALIDFDRLQRGPALAELGSLLAELINRACIAQRPLPLETIAVLTGAYQSALPWPMQCGQLAWFTAAALLRERAYRCVTSMKPGRMQALPRLLETAEHLLDGRLALPVARSRAVQSAALTGA